MKKFLLLISLFTLTRTAMCQNLNLKDLVKLSVMPFTQKDEYLTNKDYLLIGKEITCRTCEGGTSTDWYAGNKRKHLTKYSDLLNNHWGLSYHGSGSPLSYSTFSKKDYLEIKKSLATYGFKYVSVNSGIKFVCNYLQILFIQFGKISLDL